MFHCEKERKEQAHPAVQLASLALRPRELPMRSRSPLFGFTPFPNGSSALRLGMLPCTVMDVVPRGKTGVTRGHLARTLVLLRCDDVDPPKDRLSTHLVNT